MHDITFQKAIENAEHLKALGHTSVYLYDRNSDTEFPWQFATNVEAGGSYRLSGPASAKITAKHPTGLEFEWSVDFEGRDANGKSVSLFDRDHLRDVMRKLPKSARLEFGNLLKGEVLPELRKRTSEIRQALNDQQDSQDLVLGLIAFAEDEA